MEKNTAVAGRGVTAGDA